MVQKIEMQPVNRREVLKFAGTGALAVLSTSLLPGLAAADAKMVSDAIKKLVGDKTPTEGKVTVDLPQIAENGNTVPMNLEVESPMTDSDHVKSVHIFADGNPSPDVASCHFTPACGRARASIRMRLAKTQNVVVVAETSTGSVFMGKSEVKVTIGGCGG